MESEKTLILFSCQNIAEINNIILQITKSDLFCYYDFPNNNFDWLSCSSNNSLVMAYRIQAIDNLLMAWNKKLIKNGDLIGFAEFCGFHNRQSVKRARRGRYTYSEKTLAEGHKTEDGKRKAKGMMISFCVNPIKGDFIRPIPNQQRHSLETRTRGQYRFEFLVSLGGQVGNLLFLAIYNLSSGLTLPLVPSAILPSLHKTSDIFIYFRNLFFAEFANVKLT